MGGSAFAHASAEGQPTLYTPRMKPAEYEKLKPLYTRQLQVYLPGCEISVLKEAPEKDSYGDIDFMICSDDPVDFEPFANEVGAAGIIHSGGICSLAVPKDGSKHPTKVVRYKNARDSQRHPSANITEQEFAQVDIELVPPHLFRWHAFYSSYGDMSGLLGAMLHNLGFTVSDKGLHLRLKELDEAKVTGWLLVADKNGVLHLSNDPQQVVVFLGLSWERYEAGFRTMNEFYGWLAGCKLLSRSMEQYKRKNKATQRQKELKRSIITNFFNDFLPKHLGIEDPSESPEDSANEESIESAKPDLDQRRALYQDDAVTFFGKQSQYASMQNALIASIRNQHAERLIKPIIAKHSGRRERKLAELVRAFRRWVGFSEGRARVLTIPHSDQESELRLWLAEDDDTSFREPGMVEVFIKEHWEELKELERHGRPSSKGDSSSA